MRIATAELPKLAGTNASKNWGTSRVAMRVGAAIVFSALCLTICGVSRAADSDREFSYPATGPAADFAGIPCSAGAPFWAPPAATAEELPWRSVWLGHFSGGRPFEDPYYGLTLIDWLDVKVCFPARRACEAWVKRLRSAFHRPEGYWTCLLLR
jgi:hypothetical protein